MKVCVFVSVLKKGMGGHYHSLVTIVNALSRSLELEVVSIGFIPSPVLCDALNKGVSYTHIYFNGYNTFSVLRKLTNYLDGSFQFFHAYDEHSYFFARMLAFRYKVPVLLTKCGGPNPRRFFPSGENLLVFSRENQDFFVKNNYFSQVRLLPNRVAAFEVFSDCPVKIRSQIKNKKVFLRITRIGPVYEKTIADSLRLVVELNRKGVPAVLVVIGSVYCKDTLRKFEELGGENLLIFTEEEVTVDAKRIMNIADFVIGTGRSLMEAASKRKVLLTPVLERSLPELVTKDNFNSFLSTNFSERNRPTYTENESLNRIIKACQSAVEYDIYAQESISFFNKYFSISKALPAYIEQFNNLKKEAYGFKFLINNFTHFLKLTFVFVRKGYESKRAARHH